MRTKQSLQKAILSALLPILCASCGGGPGGLPCTDLYAYGLTVTVKDDVAGQPICDAVVTAVDGAHTEQLEKRAFGTDCSYVGAGERAGVYTITAVKASFMDATQSGVTVTSDACHVKGVPVMLRMKH